MQVQSQSHTPFQIQQPSKGQVQFRQLTSHQQPPPARQPPIMTQPQPEPQIRGNSQPRAPTTQFDRAPMVTSTYINEAQVHNSTAQHQFRSAQPQFQLPPSSINSQPQPRPLSSHNYNVQPIIRNSSPARPIPITQQTEYSNDILARIDRQL